MMMPSFFSNKKFVKRLNNLLEKRPSLKKDTIIEIFSNMKEKNTELSIHIFYAILDKLVDPYIIYSDISAFTYFAAIKLWNNYIMEANLNNNKACSLLLLIKEDEQGNIMC
jgi:hypothetical protein